VARTAKTLSLSLHPSVVAKLDAIGKASGRTAARVAAELVLHDCARGPAPRKEKRMPSWCCQAPVTAVRGQLVLPESEAGDRSWISAVALLCEACGRQMHAREYEGWIDG
jgi:hypothetical protein